MMCEKNILCQGFRNLVTRGHFRSRDKDGGHTHTIPFAVVKNPMLHANLMAESVIEPELWAIEVLHCVNRNRNFRRFGKFGYTVTLTLTRWPSYANLTRIAERYTVYQMRKYELGSHRFWKWSSDTYTYRVAQNKIPHETICNISATSGL